MKKMKHTLFGCALTALLCAALLIVGCSQDDEALPTGSTAFSSSSELARATAPLAQEDSDSDDSEDSESEDDDSEDSESVDDDSEDSESVDDDSEDSKSVDDDSVDDDSLDDDGTRVRDLLFVDAGCPATLTIGATIVTTTEATRFDCEPGCDGLEEGLTADQFCSYLTLGLPMRARGTDNAGAIDASRVRINDEIKAMGDISARSTDLVPGVMFTLAVAGLPDLLFVVGDGAQIDVFDVGATVRVEGIVPVLSTTGPPTFIATEIEN